MRYKALILDVDGTTVIHDPHAKASKKVSIAIQKAKKIIHVCLSTSRPLFMVKDLIEELGIVDPCAVNDATQIYDPRKKKIIKALYLNRKKLPILHSIFKRHRYSFLVNTGETEYTYSGDEWPEHVCGVAVPDISIAKAESLVDEITRKIPDVVAMKIPSYKKGLVWMTVTHPQATKLHSVYTISELIGVRPDETIGVGDGYNDYPLLSAVGLKIAMGNAVPELKAIAHFIAPTVEEDGVATVIEKFILTPNIN